MAAGRRLTANFESTVALFRRSNTMKTRLLEGKTAIVTGQVIQVDNGAFL